MLHLLQLEGIRTLDRSTSLNPHAAILCSKPWLIYYNLHQIAVYITVLDRNCQATSFPGCTRGEDQPGNEANVRTM